MTGSDFLPLANRLAMFSAMLLGNRDTQVGAKLQSEDVAGQFGRQAPPGRGHICNG